jgi:hypothetical protein
MADGRLRFSLITLVLPLPDIRGAAGSPVVVMTLMFCEGMTVQYRVARKAGISMLMGRFEPLRSLFLRELSDGAIARIGNANSSNVKLG